LTWCAAGRYRQCASFLVWLSFADEEIGAAEAAVVHCREAVALYRAGGASNVERGLRSLVRCLLNVGDVCEARLALADLIEHTRRSSWNFFSPMPALFAMLAALELTQGAELDEAAACGLALQRPKP
jgi:hypothetical protein